MGKQKIDTSQELEKVTTQWWEWCLKAQKSTVISWCCCTVLSPPASAQPSSSRFYRTLCFCLLASFTRKLISIFLQDFVLAHTARPTYWWVDPALLCFCGREVLLTKGNRQYIWLRGETAVLWPGWLAPNVKKWTLSLIKQPSEC